MFSYIAYGLSIFSQIPLPELFVSDKVADVTIKLGSVERLPHKLLIKQVRFRGNSDEVSYYVEDIGALLVRGGREIIVQPVQGVQEGVFRLFVLGLAFGMLLHQRGLLVLHASAIIVNGYSVAFLGSSGQGKSTTAAALHAHGHSIVTDDVLAIDTIDHENPLAIPSFPLLKLCPEAAAFLGYNLNILNVFDPQDYRHEFRVINDFPQTPLPLRRVYVLAEGAEQEIEILSHRKGFEELVRHTYLPDSRLLEDTGTAAAHFHRCTKLANSVPICRLKRHCSLSSLPELIKLIEEDLVCNI